jgi:hypothetical protein
MMKSMRTQSTVNHVKLRTVGITGETPSIEKTAPPVATRMSTPPYITQALRKRVTYFPVGRPLVAAGVEIAVIGVIGRAVVARGDHDGDTAHGQLHGLIVEGAHALHAVRLCVEIKNAYQITTGSSQVTT